MRISPQPFFNFCGNHVPLLRALMELDGESSEADIQRLMRTNGLIKDESAEHVWRRLKELQILVPIEQGTDYYRLADQVRRLLDYLFDEAAAATPEVINGYIRSLEMLNKQFARLIDVEDSSGIRLVLEELQQTLRRIQADLDETHRSVLLEVGRYKVERLGISVRDKFRRIVYWMERYVEPIVQMVRIDGPLHAIFDETERLLHLAQGHGLYNNLAALGRNLRYLRVVQRHALRVFQQCRRELQPLYDALRRSSFIAEGAATALGKIQRDGISVCVDRYVVPSFMLRWQHAPSDSAIERSIWNVRGYRPESAPVLALDSEEDMPASFLQRLWVEGLCEIISPELPVPDLVSWLIRRFPEKNTDAMLAGFTRLVFTPQLAADFTDGPTRRYMTADGILEATATRLSRQ